LELFGLQFLHRFLHFPLLTCTACALTKGDCLRFLCLPEPTMEPNAPIDIDTMIAEILPSPFSAA